MLTVPNELALTESRTMRAATIDRTDVLDKVKALTLLPDDAHATTELVAVYYEVAIEAINSLVKRNRAELEENGLQKLTGINLREYRTAADGHGGHLPSNITSLRLFSRRAILNVGQLLTESDVARRVRTHLLDIEQDAGLPRTLPAALRAYAAELERSESLELANVVLTDTVAKLSPKARIADQYEGNPGITPTEFHKSWFPQVKHVEFFEHLYRHDYLLDHRNTLWDGQKNVWKDGPQHRWPTAKGKRYFYLRPDIDVHGIRRQQTLVIPGNAEHDLVAALERENLPSLNRPALPGADVVRLPRQFRGGA